MDQFDSNVSQSPNLWVAAVLAAAMVGLWCWVCFGAGVLGGSRLQSRCQEENKLTTIRVPAGRVPGAPAER